MIDTNLFLDKLIDEGYTHLCVVPCSFAKNIINAAINNEGIEYIASASEAVACSIASGLTLSGKKPIVIVQSSGLTNMGSCITSLLKPYNITFPIITSWRTYKEGDSEIQHKHLSASLPSLIEAYGYESHILDKENIDTIIKQINISNSSFVINILEKDTFLSVNLESRYTLDLPYPKRGEYLQILNNMHSGESTLFVGTTGNTSREMYNIMNKTDNFYMVGNMGGALSLGLGIAKGNKDVFVLGGDAEFVMHLGGITTAGRYNNINLTYIVFDNQSNKSTGGQATYQEHINYLQIAKNSGFNIVDHIIDNLEDFKDKIPKNGLNFLHVKCSYDEDMLRPTVEAITKNRV